VTFIAILRTYIAVVFTEVVFDLSFIITVDLMSRADILEKLLPGWCQLKEA